MVLEHIKSLLSEVVVTGTGFFYCVLTMMVMEDLLSFNRWTLATFWPFERVL